MLTTLQPSAYTENEAQSLPVAFMYVHASMCAHLEVHIHTGMKVQGRERRGCRCTLRYGVTGSFSSCLKMFSPMLLTFLFQPLCREQRALCVFRVLPFSLTSPGKPLQEFCQMPCGHIHFWQTLSKNKFDSAQHQLLYSGEH